MAIYSVVYELLLPQDYEAFFGCLESYPHVYIMESCCLIDTSIDSSSIRDRLMPLIGGSDKVFVNRISQDWASVGTHCGSWLSAPERELS